MRRRGRVSRPLYGRRNASPTDCSGGGIIALLHEIIQKEASLWLDKTCFFLNSGLPFTVFVNRTLFILFAIFRFTCIFYLRIIRGKLLITELANVSIIGAAEKTSANVIKIMTPCHDNSPFLKMVDFTISVCKLFNPTIGSQSTGMSKVQL